MMYDLPGAGDTVKTRDLVVICSSGSYFTDEQAV